MKQIMFIGRIISSIVLIVGVYLETRAICLAIVLSLLLIQAEIIVAILKHILNILDTIKGRI